MGVMYVWQRRIGLSFVKSIKASSPTPPTFHISSAPRTSVWSSRSPEVVNRMGAADRLKYAALYDQVANINEQIGGERDTWRSLNGFVGFSSLTPDQMMKLNELIYRARSLERSLDSNFKIVLDRASTLGIRPEFGERRTIISAPDPSFCKPLFFPPGESR